MNRRPTEHPEIRIRISPRTALDEPGWIWILPGHPVMGCRIEELEAWWDVQDTRTEEWILTRLMCRLRDTQGYEISTFPETSHHKNLKILRKS